MEVLLVVGDQDTYHVDDPELNQSPRWLAEILSQEGLTATFVVQARRAEILEALGSREVVAALRRHEIALHGRDLHPTAPELVEGLGWEEGLAAIEAVERAELETLGRVFGQAPVASSQHRAGFAPQTLAVAARLDLPYLFAPPGVPPLAPPCWFCGALNLPFLTPVPRLLGFAGVFDDVLHDDALFAPALARLHAQLDEARDAGLPLVAIFLCHPQRLAYTGAVELYQYGNGKNRPPSSVPPGVERRRTRAEVERALANFRALVRAVRDRPDLQPTTVAGMRRRFTRPATIDAGSLRRLAEEALAPAREPQEIFSPHAIPLGGRYSPGELLLGLAESLLVTRFDGCCRVTELPAEVPRRAVLGPTEPPPKAPEGVELSWVEVLGAARLLLRAQAERGHLPAAVQLGERQVGLGALFGALAEAYLLAARGERLRPVPLATWPRYPVFARELGEAARLAAEDPLARPGLSTDAIALHTQLQTWTLAAAEVAAGG